MFSEVTRGARPDPLRYPAGRPEGSRARSDDDGRYSAAGEAQALRAFGGGAGRRPVHLGHRHLAPRHQPGRARRPSLCDDRHLPRPHQRPSINHTVWPIQHMESRGGSSSRTARPSSWRWFGVQQAGGDPFWTEDHAAAHPGQLPELGPDAVARGDGVRRPLAVPSRSKPGFRPAHRQGGSCRAPASPAGRRRAAAGRSSGCTVLEQAEALGAGEKGLARLTMDR